MHVYAFIVQWLSFYWASSNDTEHVIRSQENFQRIWTGINDAY